MRKKKIGSEVPKKNCNERVSNEKKFKPENPHHIPLDG